MESSEPIAWILLRDGHSVPLSGLSPDDLKRAAHATIVHEPHKLGRQSRLNAIVDCLGFKGDFGDYCNTHWPSIEETLRAHGLNRRTNLLEVPVNDLMIGTAGRRALADRLFFGPGPRPRRVFTGFGHDWESWDRLWGDVDAPFPWSDDGDAWTPRTLDETQRWIYSQRGQLSTAHNYLGDQLFDVDRRAEHVLMEYRPANVPIERYDRDRDRSLRVLAALRWYIDRRTDGWIEILPTPGDGLVILKGPDGLFDLLWRNLRIAPPPVALPEDRWLAPLSQLDRPGALLGRTAFASWNYYRRGAWDESERHQAELHHYAMGGKGLPEYPGMDAVLERYLRDTGVYAEKPPFPKAQAIPEGFRRLSAEAGTVLVSGLVTIAEMQAMMTESGYPDRRVGDRWEPGNLQDDASLPVAATWFDAMAYCAWMERRLGVRVRLPLSGELMRWRPLPDETKPTRAPRARAVEWLETWGGRIGEPARCRFCEPLPWRDGPGDLRFVDAIDVFEWSQEARTLNGVWHHHAFAPESWGAYKHSKVGFRLVIELADR